MSDLKVLVIGAGLGGLSLAQSLRGNGIDVAVFERDASPGERPQGYRLHLDADALNAAREVLPAGPYAVFDATAQYTEPFTTILATDLSVVKRLFTQDVHGDVWPRGEARHANVDRAVLRRILLAGLEKTVHYGRTLTHYESTAQGVTAFFADGSTARGDVLVGADGIRSAVRGQRAPQCETADAGVTAIYGRVPSSVAARFVPAETFTDIFTIASDERKVFLGLGSVRFPVAPAEAARRFAPGLSLPDQDDYVVCVVGGRHEHFAGVRDLSGHGLRTAAAEVLRDWPGRAAELLTRADPESFFVVEMRTSVPAELDPPVNVTLLGDAIHAMTPTLGRGANVAMRDAALLGRALKAVEKRRACLRDVLADYERDELTGYGFSVVREAARTGEQRMAQNPLPRG
ncbi:FAD-dependent oxidoreductase [Lentzea sp. NPDC058436]|uniref:FAD-dependent oxidoreductase n=1 Tax=Lentzea sp. NPDC058436 TaxID=3346499 RepID=UPI0036484CAF